MHPQSRTIPNYALYKLGVMYQTGHNVDVNTLQTLSANQGHELAIEQLKALKNIAL